jgi:hypothetical protein
VSSAEARIAAILSRTLDRSRRSSAPGSRALRGSQACQTSQCKCTASRYCRTSSPKQLYDFRKAAAKVDVVRAVDWQVKVYRSKHRLAKRAHHVLNLSRSLSPSSSGTTLHEDLLFTKKICVRRGSADVCSMQCSVERSHSIR